MSEVSNQLQHKYSGRKLYELFDKMEAKIEQLDISVVIEGPSQEVQIGGASRLAILYTGQHAA